MWKPAHHLRQEEAADRARQASILSRNELAAALDETSLPMHPALRPSTNGEASNAGAMQSLQSILTGGADSRAEGTAQAAGLFIALIDQVVPRGVVSLQQALASYPSLLTHHTYLQSAIEREPSPFVRQQLRQTVTNALVNIQMAQSARQQLQQEPNSLVSLGHPAATSSMGATAGDSTPSEQESAHAGPGERSSETPRAGAPNFVVPHPIQNPFLPRRRETITASTGEGSGAGAGAGAAAAATGGPAGGLTGGVGGAEASSAIQTPIPTPAVPVSSAQTLPQPAAPTPVAPAPAPVTAHAATVPIPTQAPAPAPIAGAAPTQRHPHMAPAESMPARVFKLQFDAHKIVCCTQAHNIVGWDFCNNDPELEEVSRFFATVD